MLGLGGVRTFVRLRPTSDKSEINLFEFSPARPGVVTIKDPLSSGRCEHSFEFTGVFNADDDQDRVFATVASSAVDGALSGQSGCILAYGQTGSGKTFSIFGEGAGDRRGLLPRAAERLLGHGGSQNYRVAVSFLEVYNDQVYDLVGSEPGAPGASGVGGQRANAQTSFTAAAGAGLEIHEKGDGRLHVRGLSIHETRTAADVMQIIDRGLAKRATAATAANSQSSRSHTVFSMYVSPHDGCGRGSCPKPPAKGDASAPTGVALSFVDLAGSERVTKSRADGARFQEAVSINSSLTSLGKVILALAAAPGSSRHVPYRDSKLTRLLSSSLRGGSRISLLATLHPRVEDYEESLNTLSFADRCKNVAHQPQVNYIGARPQTRIRDLQAQVKQLQDLLQQQQAPAGVVTDDTPRALATALRRHRTSDCTESLDKAIAEAIGDGAVCASVKSLVAVAPAPLGGGGLMPRAASDAALPHAAPPAGAASAPSAAPGAVAWARTVSNSTSRPDDASVAERQAPAAAPKRVTSQATGGGNGGSGGGDGAVVAQATLAAASAKAPPQSDPAIQALVELQKERQRQTAAQEKAIAKMEALELQKQQMKEASALRSAEVSELERRGSELEAAIAHSHAELTRAREELKRRHDAGRVELREGLDASIQGIDGAFLRLPDKLGKEAEASTRQQEDFRERRHELHTESRHALWRMQSSEYRHLHELRTRWSEKVDMLEKSNKSLEEALAKESARAANELSALQGELLSVCGVVSNLTGIVSDAEGGKFPVIRHDGLKQVVLPKGLRASLPTAQECPFLFKALGKADAARQVADARASFGPAKRVDASTAPGPGWRRPSLPPSGCVASGDTLGAEAVPVTMPLPVAKLDDCLRMVGFNTVEEDGAGGLSAPKLRELCVALRAKCLEVFSPGEEREALRQEAIAGLDDQATSRYIQDLESQRDAARAELADAVERRQCIRVDLEHCQTRPPSSCSRPTTGTTRTESRASSRPTTAGRSRPPTARR